MPKGPIFILNIFRILWEIFHLWRNLPTSLLAGNIVFHVLEHGKQHVQCPSCPLTGNVVFHGKNVFSRANFLYLYTPSNPPAGHRVLAKSLGEIRLGSSLTCVPYSSSKPIRASLLCHNPPWDRHKFDFGKGCIAKPRIVLLIKTRVYRTMRKPNCLSTVRM